MKILKQIKYFISTLPIVTNMIVKIWQEIESVINNLEIAKEKE